MKRVSVLVGLMLLAVSTAAQASDVIANWAAPSTWTPPSTQAAGRSALVTYPPLPFIPLSPCRLADIRVGSGFPAGYGPPAIVSGGVRNFTITGVCGIPAGASAVSFNFAVWAPTTRGDLRVYPAGVVPVPVVSTLNWEAGILALANAAVVPLGTAGAITVKNDGTTPLQIFIDVNGYYTSSVGASTFRVDSTSSFGIVGTSTTGVGIWGLGVVDGIRGSLQGAVLGSAGVHGVGASVVNTYGVWGQQGATIPDNFGSSGGVGGYFTSQGTWGALANSPERGMQGDRVDGTSGLSITGGVLGYAGSSGVHSFSDVTAGGIKSFVEPHPTDPGKQIVYVAMEGPEAGTYFRGRGRFEGKSAVIAVPESFRLVTEEEGLTVQITPIGHPTAVGVTSADLNQIVVEANRDVEFSYLVQGVRHHRGQFEAIQPNTYFVPVSADARMDPWSPQIQKQLVDLGIYSSDGRVIMETAERMGWAQKWRDDEAKAKAAQEGEAAKAKAK
jgi:hypothetical protein